VQPGSSIYDNGPGYRYGYDPVVMATFPAFSFSFGGGFGHRHHHW
jgi:hypothetical protein